jgi:hypothetical protein
VATRRMKGDIMTDGQTHKTWNLRMETSRKNGREEGYDQVVSRHQENLDTKKDTMTRDDQRLDSQVEEGSRFFYLQHKYKTGGALPTLIIA